MYLNLNLIQDAVEVYVKNISKCRLMLFHI